MKQLFGKILTAILSTIAIIIANSTQYSYASYHQFECPCYYHYLSNSEDAKNKSKQPETKKENESKNYTMPNEEELITDDDILNDLNEELEDIPDDFYDDFVE